ncbi:MAG: hypothetical protein NZV14_19610 [Bryobacteraceae bacterium]|nr:hypothetical protein [Bryobacteraceae bacterium]MDW8380372.1 hypothetical protein [Bryobacterales bacterium]
MPWLWPKPRKALASKRNVQAASGKTKAAVLADQRLQRLARKLDAIPAKDAERLAQAQEIERKQLEAAQQLHQLCADFVTSLNNLLSQMKVEFTPPNSPTSELYSRPGALFQINASGRIIQITFQAKESKASTEHFRIPYILEGRICSFNPELLDRQEVFEQQIFYCLDGAGDHWRYYNPRTRSSGPLTRDFLIETLEQLL